MLFRPMMLRSAGAAALRPQDVFATSLYMGTRASLQITNGLNLLTNGGLVWPKDRDSPSPHALIDTARGVNKVLVSNTTAAEVTGASGNEYVTAFNNDGFTLGPNGDINSFGDNTVAWSFRRAPKFFDIVTYTGDGTSGRQIPHALGIPPGMVIVKRRDVDGSGWAVGHRSLSDPASGFLLLSNTNSQSTSTTIFTAAPTSTVFSVGTSVAVNASGSTYVAYLFAHDPDSVNGIVQCGSGNVTLPWPPQWVLYKDAGATGDWMIADATRGFSPDGSYPTLQPNKADAETASASLSISGNTLTFTGMTNPVWVAIRAPV